MSFKEFSIKNNDKLPQTNTSRTDSFYARVRTIKESMPILYGIGSDKTLCLYSFEVTRLGNLKINLHLKLRYCEVYEEYIRTGNDSFFTPEEEALLAKCMELEDFIVSETKKILTENNFNNLNCDLSISQHRRGI